MDRILKRDGFVMPERSRRTIGREIWSLIACGLLATGDLQAQDPLPGWPAALRAEVSYTGDILAAAGGGASQKPVYLDNLDMLLDLNLGALLDAGNASVRVHFQSNRGNSISARVGDLQGVSNIEAPSEWRLYEFWVEHDLLPGRLSLLAGVYDVNAEFDVVPIAGDLVNSSFGFGPDFSLTGINGPSTFPLTTLGVRIKARPLPQAYAALAIVDGSPGDPMDPERSRFELGNGEGALIAVELGYTRAVLGAGETADELPTRVQTGGHRIGRGRTVQRLQSKFAVGAWTYTRDFERWQSGEPARSWGVYAVGERRVIEGTSDYSGLSLFARAGAANDQVNRLSVYLGGGAVYSGILPGRPDDVVQLGVAHARNGSPFLQALDPEGDLLERAETVIEFGYRAQLGPFVSLQPDIQWVINPGMDRRLDDALVIGIRGIAALELPF